MNILILGGDGMLGHQLRKSLSHTHTVHATVRHVVGAHEHVDLVPEGLIESGDILDQPRLTQVIDDLRPNVILNCVGIVKQRPDATSPVPSILVNSLLPHQLNDHCRRIGARLIHFSTDCVFSGRAGGYRETDIPDPVDLYGRTKLVGEVGSAPGLTLRTSIIGLELSRKTGLIEWFLAQHGTVKGFRRAIYSGVTTAEMGRLVGRLLEQHPDLTGIWHVASDPIAKYDLLAMLARALGRTDVTLVPDDAFACDRSLRADALRQATGYEPPPWEQMLAELAAQVERRERGENA